MKRWVLAGIILLAFLVRVYAINKYPIGFTPDEASFGYDAYSLLASGRDQWGKSWPLILQSFGDGKLPLYTYLALPSVAVFGLNEFSTRLPSVVVGTLAILAVYLLSKKLFENEKFGLVSASLLAISPWHISLSRGAFEANLTVFFMSMAAYLFLNKKYAWSALLFGINLFSYHSARLVTPLIITALVVWKHKEISVKKNFLGIATFGLFFVLAVFTVFSGGASRAGDVTIFNPTDKWMGMFNDRYSKIFDGEPYILAKLFTNKYTYIADQFSNAYSTYLSPQFLFTLGASETTYGMVPGVGVMYTIELIFVLFALYKITQNKRDENQPLLFLVFWVLVSILPAALTKGPGYAANRAAVMMPAMQILSAYGLVSLNVFISNKYRKIDLKVLSMVFVGIMAVSFVFYLENYFYKAPRQMASGMLFGRRQALEYVFNNYGKYDRIIVSRSLSEPQIYAAFYGKLDPKLVQDFAKSDWARYKGEKLPFLDQLGEYKLDKLVFKDIHYGDEIKDGSVLLVGKPSEFPSEFVPTEVIKYPDQTPAIFIYGLEK